MMRRCVLLKCFFALWASFALGEEEESSVERMDRIKIFQLSSSYATHVRHEFIAGFRRQPLFSNPDVFFFATIDRNASAPLQRNIPVLSKQPCFNTTSTFECRAPVTYMQHLLDQPKTFLKNVTLSAVVRHLICRRLLFEVMVSKNKTQSMKMFDLHLFCPNPCRDGSKRPCAHRNSVSDMCLRSPTLIYDNSFSCQCEKFMIWSTTFQRCVSDYRTRIWDRDNGHCDLVGTKMVEDTGFSYKCLCKAGFVGYKCDQIIDNCLSRFGGYYAPQQVRSRFRSSMSGQIACRVFGTNNSCIAFNQKMTGMTTHGYAVWIAYTCLCQRPFFRDYSLPFPNCLARENACDVLPCLHGRCTASGSNAMCLCDPGWTGRLCDSLEQEEPFLEWSIWSQCLPVCGAQRFRFRERQCLVATCRAARHQSRPCRPRACFRYFLLHRLLDAMKVRDKATDVLFDLGFLTVWFFTATVVIAALYVALFVSGPFLDRVEHTHHVASFFTWWRAKREGVAHQLGNIRKNVQ